MGITLLPKDFVDCMTKPIPVTLNFICCYVMMPLLALAIGKALALPNALLAGLVLVGSINGGQASNLCTYIAKGDVALSVVMTTSTTIGCIFMTPLIAKLVLGTVVPVDPVGIAISTVQARVPRPAQSPRDSSPPHVAAPSPKLCKTATPRAAPASHLPRARPPPLTRHPLPHPLPRQVVLVPVIVGVLANMAVPKACRAIEPFCPLVGVAATVVLVGASVAQCATVRRPCLALPPAQPPRAPSLLLSPPPPHLHQRHSAQSGSLRPAPLCHRRTSAPRACSSSGRSPSSTSSAASPATGSRASSARRAPALRTPLRRRSPTPAAHLSRPPRLPRLRSPLPQSEKVCRTVAIETAMKSSAFGFLLASLHFGCGLASPPLPPHTHAHRHLAHRPRHAAGWPQGAPCVLA